MTNSDLSRIINSDEVQTHVVAPKEGTKPAVLKRNPLKVAAVMDELNPAAGPARAAATKAQAAAEAAKKSKKRGKESKESAARKKTFYATLVAED